MQAFLPLPPRSRAGAATVALTHTAFAPGDAVEAQGSELVWDRACDADGDVRLVPVVCSHENAYACTGDLPTVFAFNSTLGLDF